MEARFTVADQGVPVAVTRDVLLRAAGPSQAIASALAFRLFSMALADLSPKAPPERTAIAVLTALPGQGFLDCVAFVIRPGNRKGGRLAVDTEAGPAEAPASVEGRFYFEFGLGGRRRAYWPRPGLFDATFRRMVGRYQDATCSRREAEDYRAYKQGLVARILETGRDALFSQWDMDPPRMGTG